MYEVGLPVVTMDELVQMSLNKARTVQQQRGGKLINDMPRTTGRPVAVVHDRYGRPLDTLYELES